MESEPKNIIINTDYDSSNNKINDLKSQENIKIFVEKQREKHRIYLRDLVIRQTNYDEETAIKKLEEHNGDVISIIREYMGPSKKKEKNSSSTSTNQIIMKEIRTMMDDAALKYRIQKDLNEKKKVFIEKMMQQQKESNKKNQDNNNEHNNNQDNNNN